MSLQFEVSADCVSEGFEILLVRRDDEIVASQCPFGDTGVDDARCARLGCEGADGTCAVIIDGLDIAPAE